MRRSAWTVPVLFVSLLILPPCAPAPAHAGEGGGLVERARAGDVDAMVELGLAFMQDWGDPASAEQAFRWLDQAARIGDGRGQYLLGRLYFSGKGVAEDMEKSFALIGAAAQKGHVDAMLFLGEMHLHGWGTEKDPRQTLHWYTKAMDAGHKTAAFEISRLYVGDDRLGDNPCERLKWLGVSAQRDLYPPAMNSIGEMYEEGLCVGRDMEKALAWYRAAADRGHEYAAERYEDLATRDQRGGMPKRYHDLELKAEAGDADAMRAISEFYRSGPGENEQFRDPAKGIEWLERAANAGNRMAMSDLYYIYFMGKEGLERNPEMAFKWGLMAAQAGDPTAMKNVADMYYEGDGVARDGLQAARWYEKILSYSDFKEQALMSLVRIFLYGEGAQADHCRAHSFCMMAIEMNKHWAMRMMGDMYARGQCVEKDYDQAMVWYGKAQENGDSFAKYGIEKLEAERDLLGIWVVSSGAQGSQGAGDKIITPGDGKYTEYKTGFADADLAEVLDKANAGDRDAMGEMGNRYNRGIGVDKDIDIAWQWYMKAAENDNVGAQYYVGLVLYNYNHAEKKDPVRGRQWMEKAAQQNFAPAQHGLGDLEYKPVLFEIKWDFNNEYVIDQERVCRGFAWYEKAAKQNYAPSQRQIGFMYLEGHCVRADRDLALLWLRAAAANGDQEATNFLNEEVIREAVAENSRGDDSSFSKSGDVLTGDTPTGFENVESDEVRRRADAGDGNAMVEMGRRELAKYDIEAGMGWLDKAADLQNPLGQYALGVEFWEESTFYDDAGLACHALQLLSEAAAKNHIDASASLALIWKNYRDFIEKANCGGEYYMTEEQALAALKQAALMGSKVALEAISR